MQKIMFFIIVSSIAISSCTKDTGGSSIGNGIITGPDFALCPCCGGTFIEIGESTYRMDSVPPSSGIDLQNGPFPINVELTYTRDTAKCFGLYIKSNDIHRR